MKQFKPTSRASSTEYYRIKGGRFVNQNSSLEFVQGKFTSIWLKEDEGNPQLKIKPNTVVSVTMFNEEDNVRQVVQTNTNSKNACLSLLKSLMGVNKEDTIAITARSGNDPKITFVNIHKYDPTIDDYNVVMIDKGDGSTEEQLTALLTEIQNHNAFFVPEQRILEDEPTTQEQKTKNSKVEGLDASDLNW